MGGKIIQWGENIYEISSFPQSQNISIQYHITVLNSVFVSVSNLGGAGIKSAFEYGNASTDSVVIKCESDNMFGYNNIGPLTNRHFKWFVITILI